MVRPFGTKSQTETKNKIINLRVTAREYAKTLLLARYSNHNISEILRRFIDDGLKSHAEDFKIINCNTSYLLSIRSKMNNNNNRRSWFKPKPLSDKLYYKKPPETEPSLPLPDPSVDLKEAWTKQDKYLSFLEETLTASIKEDSEKDPLSLYEKSCKARRVEPDLLFSQTLSLEQRDRREAKKRD